MVHKILRQYPSDPRWYAEPMISEEEIKSILNQKFHYFRRGMQCYAFLSEDGQYIIKFFNQAHHKDNDLKRRERDLLSNFIAYRELKEDTGLLMIHFCSEKPLNQSITLVDGCHIAHTIDLDNVEFLLQRRMKLPLDVIDEAMAQGNEQEAKDFIHELFGFLHKRLDKGLLDYDSKLYTNYGFIGKKAYQLDAGQVAKVSCVEDYQRDLEHFHVRNRRFQRWLNEKYPSLLPCYLSEVDALDSHFQKLIQQGGLHEKLDRCDSRS